MADPTTDTALRWSIHCRVVDNFGDIGVCWRLAAELGARGHAVRLVIDDSSALGWLAPVGATGVTVVGWGDASPDALPDVVIETFGCALPDALVERLFAAPSPPIWINLEYLSAERFAEESHGLASPQFGATGRRIDKWFFYPGFGERSGGLIREAGLIERRVAFARDGWLASRGAARAQGERVVSLFCYENPALDPLLDSLAADPIAPTLLLATAGSATAQVVHALGASMRRGALRAVAMPLLSQTDYDHLLWSSDVNFVRGEDSFVRAQWAGVPFVWQAYPQHDGAHAAKVEAFVGAMDAADDVRTWFRVWNGIDPRGRDGTAAFMVWPAMPEWRAASASWQRALAAQADLVTRLVGFVAGKR